MDTGNYYELLIPVEAESLREQLIAELAEIGYDGFEESTNLLKAYIPQALYRQYAINNILNKHNLSCSESIINKQNWNELWESNFEPVQVDDFVGIRAYFHPPLKNVIHEIVITPKMSFGTGHHATTHMMMQLMKELELEGKSVFDFGTGTGILAILAEKLGAKQVLAVDNDAWCIENASENILVNSCNNIDIQKIDSLKIKEKVDFLLANINKNIILDNILLLRDGLISGGQLLLSGLLEEDEKDILSATSLMGLQHLNTIKRNGWIAMRFNMNS